MEKFRPNSLPPEFPNSSNPYAIETPADLELSQRYLGTKRAIPEFGPWRPITPDQLAGLTVGDINRMGARFMNGQFYAPSQNTKK